MSQTQQQSDSGSTVPQTEHYDFNYEKTSRMAYGSQQEVADAWAEGKFPTHNVGRDGGAILYSGSPQVSSRTNRPKGRNTNFYGVQEPNGEGTLWHYNTREAIRLVDGTVISNQQCWSSGFAHCSTPDNFDYSIPLDAIEEHLDSEDTVFDIDGVLGQPETVTSYSEYNDEFRTSSRTRVENSVVVINGERNSYGVYLGRDSTIWQGNRYFTMRLSAEEIRDLDAPSDALDLLLPDKVAASQYEVVGANEYAKTYLSSDEREAHIEAGGHTSSSNSRYRSNRQLNRQQYRADLQGSVIVRHGEWFFIPVPAADPFDGGHGYAYGKLDNHRPTRFHGARSPLPEQCPWCAGSIHVENDGEVSCNECGNDIDRRIYVHGQIKHTDGDHRAINLGDTWHLAVSHDRNCRIYDDNPTNGGGGGWD